MAPNRRQTLSRPDVRFGSKADVTLLNFNVRFTPNSGHRTAALARLLTDLEPGHLLQRLSRLRLRTTRDFEPLLGFRRHRDLL